MSEQQGMKCKYLKDTSALYPILLSGVSLKTEDCAISTLTEYEIGNVLWQENQHGKIKDPHLAAKTFSKAIQALTKLEIDSIANVLAVATARNLTFYDASYAYLAEKKNLALVTQDIHLLKKCIAAIQIKDMQ